MSLMPQQEGEEDLFADVRRKYKNRQVMFFSRDSACLRGLQSDMQAYSHQALVLWAFCCAQEALKKLGARYPDDPRPGEALSLSLQWAQGTIKMPQARRAILSLHAMAKEMEGKADAALCHALGHACATVHTQRHAIGLPIYELTALLLERGITGFEQAALDRISAYRACLRHMGAEPQGGPWAAFLRDK